MEVFALVLAANFWIFWQLHLRTNLIIIIFFQPSYATIGHKTDLRAIRSYDKRSALNFWRRNSSKRNRSCELMRSES